MIKDISEYNEFLGASTENNHNTTYILWLSNIYSG